MANGDPIKTQEQPYSEKLYGIMKSGYGDKFTHTPESFSQKLNSDQEYRDKIYGIMKEGYKDKFVLTPDEFKGRISGQPPGKPSPDGSGAPSVNQKPDLQSGLGQPQTGSRAFDPFSKSREAAQQQMSAPTTEQSKAQSNVFDPIKEYREVGPGVPENAAQKKNTLVSEYENAQKSYADESKFSLNVAGTAEKYIGKPLSQNFEQQRHEVKLINDTHEKVLAEKRKASDYYQQKVVDEVIKPKVSEVLKDGGHASFTMKNDIGNVDVVDPYKVGKKADQIAIQNGQPTDGFFRRYVYNTLKNETNFKIIEGDIKKTFDAKAAPLLKANQQKIEEGFTTDEIEAAKFKDATTALAQDLSAQQQSEVDAISNEYKQFAEAGQNPSYDEYLKQLNVINSKYNKRYQREADELYKITEANVKKAAEQYSKTIKDDPELEKKLNDLYKESYKEVYDKRQKNIAATEGAIGANIIGGNTYLHLKSAAVSTGGVFKGWGASLGSQTLEDLGEYMEQKYTTAPAETKGIASYFNPQNLAKLSGQLSGSMIPSMGAAFVATAATGGMGGGAGASMITGGLTSFAATAVDASGRAYAETFEKTGNVGDAEKAAKKTFDAEMDIILLYSLDALPFVGDALQKIGSKGVRVAAGGTAEVLTEFSQEMLENISAENISAGNEAWDNLSEKLTDTERLKETALSIALVAAPGAAGQLGSKSRKEALSDYYSSQQAKANMNGIVEDQGRQFIQGIVFNKDEKTALATISTLYTSGQITEAKMQEMTAQVQEAKQIEQTAKEAKLSPNDRDIYSFYSGRMNEAKRKAAETQDPILSKVYTQQAKDYENAAVEFLQTGKGDFLSITYKDGSQFLMTPEDAKQAAENPEFQQDVEKGNIQVSAFGKDGAKVIGDINTQIEQKKQAAIVVEEENKKAKERVEAEMEAQPEALTPDEIKAKESLGEKIYTAEDVDSMMEEDEVIEECPPGYVKAEHGMQMGLRKGGKWEIVHEFKGKSHKEGGIDIEIVGGQIKYGGDGGKKLAKGGFFDIVGDFGKLVGDLAIGEFNPNAIKASDYNTNFFRNTSTLVEGFTDQSPIAKISSAVRKDTLEERTAGMGQSQIDLYNRAASISKPITGVAETVVGSVIPIAGAGFAAANAMNQNTGHLELPPQDLGAASPQVGNTQQSNTPSAQQQGTMQAMAQVSAMNTKGNNSPLGTNQEAELSGGMQAIQINGAMYGYNNLGNFVKLT